MRPRHCLPFRTGACKSARPPRSPCNGWMTAAERPALGVFYVRLAAGDERARTAFTLGTAWLRILCARTRTNLSCTRASRWFMTPTWTASSCRTMVRPRSVWEFFYEFPSRDLWANGTSCSCFGPRQADVRWMALLARRVLSRKITASSRVRGAQEQAHHPLRLEYLHKE